MDNITEYVKEQIQASGERGFSSKAAEQGIICRMITDKDVARQYAGALSPNDFYEPERGKIFAAIQATVIKKQAVDLVTVDNTISEMFPAERSTLTDAMVGCVNEMSLEFRQVDEYVEIVKNLSKRRQSIIAFEGIVKALKDPTKDTADVIEQARQQTVSAAQGRDKWQSMTEVLVNTYDYLEKRQSGEIRGITTGLSSVDKLIGGFFPGELTIIGARPSVGKSAFGANIAMAAAKSGYKVAIVSREMSDVQYGQRMISNHAMVDGMKLRKAELDSDDWVKITEVLSEISVLPISFLFTASTIEDVKLEVQQKVEKGELDMLIVDYLQLMRTKRRFDKDNLRVGYIIKELKEMAVDFNIPVIALAQVNRDSDGQMPSLRNLKDSGNIEQDADGVIFLHRPRSASDQYVDPLDKEFFESYALTGFTYLCIKVAKQRQGMVGATTVLFRPDVMRYTVIDRERKVPENAGTNGFTGTAKGEAEAM